MNIKKIKIKAFTLVELIIVITILSILATIAFVSFQNYIKTSRDSSKVTSLKVMESWLQTFQIKVWNYPQPDNSLDIVWVSDQWYIRENIKNLLKISNIDSNINYIYSVTKNKLKCQLWVYLEERNNIYFTLFSNTYAWNSQYTWKYLYVVWNLVWILYDKPSNIPVQEIYTWSLNLATNTGTFIAQFANTSTNSGVLEWTWWSLYTKVIEIQNSSSSWSTIPSWFAFNPIVSISVKNFDVYSSATASWWDWVLPLNATITINAWVVIGSTSTSIPALSVSGSFTTGTSIKIVNNWTIVWKWWAGWYGWTWNGNPTPWENGGTGLFTNRAVVVENNGSIFWWGWWWGWGWWTAHTGLSYCIWWGWWGWWWGYWLAGTWHPCWWAYPGWDWSLGLLPSWWSGWSWKSDGVWTSWNWGSGWNVWMPWTTWMNASWWYNATAWAVWWAAWKSVIGNSFVTWNVAWVVIWPTVP